MHYFLGQPLQVFVNHAGRFIHICQQQNTIDLFRVAVVNFHLVMNEHRKFSTDLEHHWVLLWCWIKVWFIENFLGTICYCHLFLNVVLLVCLFISDICIDSESWHWLQCSVCWCYFIWLPKSPRWGCVSINEFIQLIPRDHQDHWCCLFGNRCCNYTLNLSVWI